MSFEAVCLMRTAPSLVCMDQWSVELSFVVRAVFLFLGLDFLRIFTKHVVSLVASKAVKETPK